MSSSTFIIFFTNKNHHTYVNATYPFFKSTANALANLMAVRGEVAPEKQEVKPKQASNGTYACDHVVTKGYGGTKFTSKAEEERWESIQFENALQNQVHYYYIIFDNLWDGSAKCHYM